MTKGDSVCVISVKCEWMSQQNLVILFALFLFHLFL